MLLHFNFIFVSKSCIQLTFITIILETLGNFGNIIEYTFMLPI